MAATAPVTLSPRFSSEEFRRVEKWRVWDIAPEKDDDVRGLTKPGSVLLVLFICGAGTLSLPDAEIIGSAFMQSKVKFCCFVC